MKLVKRQMNEAQYRKVSKLSYSAINTFRKDRNAFYKEHILGYPRKESSSVSLILGTLVHTMLAEIPIDEKFHIQATKDVKGQMLELVEVLFQNYQQSMIDGEQTLSFVDNFEKSLAYLQMNDKFKGKKSEAVLNLFNTTSAVELFNEKVENADKTTVNESLLQKAEDIVKNIKEHQNSAFYANVQTDETHHVYTELPIFFNMDGNKKVDDDEDYMYKSMIDKVIVNVPNKTIQPIDWKTAWDSESPEKAYIKNGYYLQAAMYNIAIEEWVKKNYPEWLKDGFRNYTLLPMIYIFCDTANNNAPVILKLTYDDLLYAFNGFTYKYEYYEGLYELTDDINWHLATGIWNESRINHKNKGIVHTNINYTN